MHDTGRLNYRFNVLFVCEDYEVFLLAVDGGTEEDISLVLLQTECDLCMPHIQGTRTILHAHTQAIPPKLHGGCCPQSGPYCPNRLDAETDEAQKQ